MDSIATTPVPASDIIQPGNRSMSRRLSTRFPSSKDAMYPDDLANDFGQSPLSGSRRGLDSGMRSRTLQRNPSTAQRGSGSARFEMSMSMRRGSMEDEDEEEEEESDQEGGQEDEDEEEGEGTKGEEEPVRMSLMALLAESEGSAYMMDEDDEDDEATGEVGGESNSCCVCMVRHKGAAFVPCGHSFCRLCSRELWVEGGNCPLCNNFILEILDIF